MSKYEKNLVSVVIPTYRHSEMLTRAIESVLNQSYSNLELILVNDNNPDDEFTEDIKGKIKSYENDPRFHFIIQRKHINGAVARNVGIKQAKGEYLAFLDDDDWWEPNKIEEQVETIKILFMKESTEGVAEGQTTAEAGKPESEGNESVGKTV